ncbi:MAG: hypothetical protein ACK6DC_08250 [Planctomycetota bacterium]|jgi:hypothetical protein
MTTSHTPVSNKAKVSKVTGSEFSLDEKLSIAFQAIEPTLGFSQVKFKALGNTEHKGTCCMIT